MVDHPDQTLLAQLSREIIIVCDPQGHILWADQRAALLGARPGGTFADLVITNDHGKAQELLTSARSATVRSCELTLHAGRELTTFDFSATKSGENLLLVGCKLLSGPELGMGELSRMVSEVATLHRETARQERQLRRQQEQLRQSEERARELADVAQEAVRVRDAFLSIAAHEVKTPLSALLAGIELLEHRASLSDAYPARDRERIAMLMDQVHRLKRMIGDLFDLSSLDSGQLQVQRRPLDLGALIRRLAGSITPSLVQHTLSCRLPDEPLTILGDELRLEQVFNNLLQNAIKYSPAGGPIDIDVVREGDSVTVAVIDRGLGIPAAALPNLFRRFYRVESVDKGHVAGMGLGLGLYVVQELVRLHDGSISVSSVEGQGSTFTVRLPLAPEQPDDQR